LLADVDNVRKFPDRNELQSFVRDVHQVLLDDPEEAAVIVHNIKILRALFESSERKAA